MLMGRTLLIFFLVFLPAAAAAGGKKRNYLLSGQRMEDGDFLQYDNYTLVMQGDCNLVLYDDSGRDVWQANTTGSATHCQLTLDAWGTLHITSFPQSVSVWNSGEKSTVAGIYAAVVHPLGNGMVYGPGIPNRMISVSPRHHTGRTAGTLDGAPVAAAATSRKSTLFSGTGGLGTGESLTAGDRSLVMQKDCNLVLYVRGGDRVGWESNTRGRGEGCRLLLGRRGELFIQNDESSPVWSSRSVISREPGDYVLTFDDKDPVVVYGPAIWSTRKLTT